MAKGNMLRKLMKTGRVVPWICSWTDRQTHRQKRYFSHLPWHGITRLCTAKCLKQFGKGSHRCHASKHLCNCIITIRLSAAAAVSSSLANCYNFWLKMLQKRLATELRLSPQVTALLPHSSKLVVLPISSEPITIWTGALQLSVETQKVRSHWTLTASHRWTYRIRQVAPMCIPPNTRFQRHLDQFNRFCRARQCAVQTDSHTDHGTWVINQAVGCHYFPPGPQLPPQPLGELLPISLLGEQRHDGCEQFA